MARRNKELLTMIIMLLNSFSIAQDNYVTLNQGIVSGLKIFPETSKTPVYAFLGIPYAQPPIGNLRFAPPKPHYGWNQTYHAKSFKPICPQLTNSIYDETSDRLLRQLPQMDEDCLYINIWSPEIGLRYGNLPVLVILTGEEMSFDWPQNRPSGLDLATEDLIVVTIQYRMNIFGWLTTITMKEKQKSKIKSTSTRKLKTIDNKNDNSSSNDDDDDELIGNYGLRDQYLALIWIKENIHKFGGNPEQITLLGHGNNGGAIYALIHLLNMRKNENLFSKLILMSGNSRYLNDLKRTIVEKNDENLKNNQNNDSYNTNFYDEDNDHDKDVNYFNENDDDFMMGIKQSPSEQIIIKLGCQFLNLQQISNCLRSKSIGDLQKSFESIYKNGNYTVILGPILDYKYLNERQRFFHKNPLSTLLNGKFRKLPILCGICTNEGAFIRDYWIDLAREGISTLKNYINYTIIPLILKKYSFYENEFKNDGNMYDNNRNQLAQIYKAIQWRYFEQESKNSIYILSSLQRLISEADYEAQFYNMIELIARSVSQKFSYNKNNSRSSLEQQMNSNFYVYAFHLTNSMDMRGKINLFGGASHSSDLPLLMGPSLFQQISRRRLTVIEYKLCKRLKQYFSDFIKTGNPTPGNLYDEWLSYSTDRKFIKILGDNPNFLKSDTMLQFEQNLPAIEDMLEKSAGSGYTIINNKDHPNSYYSRNNGDGSKESITSDSRRNKSLLSSSSSSSSSSYYVNRQDYEYFQYLKIVYSFWNVLLPSIYKTRDSKPKIDNSSTERAGREFNFYESDSIKYKHAFFSMLALVCFLLGILGICLYILRKNYPNFGTNL